MNTKTMYIAMALLTMVSSCGKKVEQEERKAVKVKTERIVSQSLDGAQSYSGTVEEIAGTALSFPAGGTIKQILVSEGQMVQAGQLIAVADASSLRNGYAMATAATEQAEETLKQAQDAYRRMKMLHDAGSLPEIKWVEVQTKVSQAEGMVRQAKAAEAIARKGVADSRLVAPFSGYISQKTAEVGQNVLPGQLVAKLVKIDQVKVTFSVPEAEIAQLHKGEPVQISVEALGGRIFNGTVSEKAVSANPISRSYEVKALVTNTGHELLPGMVCSANVGGKSNGMGVSIPADIVQIDSDNRTFVWIAVGGKAQKREIKVGDNVGERVIVLSGLSVGDELITEGQQKVSRGMQVTK